jgi:hypothetical protein
VLIRDVSASVRVAESPKVVACAVLDMETGLVLGVRLEATEREAVAGACSDALQGPIGLRALRRQASPNRILCDDSLVAKVRAHLTSLKQLKPLPSIEAAGPVAEAESLLDSLIAELAGHGTAGEPASAELWDQLYSLAERYDDAQPWSRWGDDVGLFLEIEEDTDDEDVDQRVAIVLGASGIEFGLAVYPDDDEADLDERYGSPDFAPPSGTLLLTLLPPAELPPDLVDRALRHGWPADRTRVAAALCVVDGEFAEPDAGELRTLVVALSAALAADELAGARAGDDDFVVEQTVTFAGGGTCSYVAEVLPLDDEDLRLDGAGTSLFGESTFVGVGAFPAGELDAMRRTADVHLPLGSGAPVMAADQMVPAIILLPLADDGPELVQRLVALGPSGLAFVEQDGTVTVSLAGERGEEPLVEFEMRDPVHATLRRGLAESGGWHLIAIGDPSRPNEKVLLGLIELSDPVDGVEAGADGPADLGALQLKIALKGAKPPIWRRVLFPSDGTLFDLHQTIQVAMGWSDCHLHVFTIGERRYGRADDGDMADIDERTVTAGAVFANANKGEYWYDFGDDWRHTITVERRLPDHIGPLISCIAGKRACPPEDCGGVWGYAGLLAALTEPPGSPNREERLEWLGEDFDPEHFDREAVNRILHQARRL